MTLARPATPPRGWNSWNAYRTRIDEHIIRRNAELMVSLGLRDAGYDTLVIDDGWQSRERIASGGLAGDPVRFPDIARLADDVHALGLRFGMYGSPGIRTCAMIYDGYPGEHLGSYQHEQQDLDQLVAWGIDFLKYDWCQASVGTRLGYQEAFRTMSELVARAPREVVLSISEYGATNPWEWAGELASMWRTTGDIEASYASMISIGTQMRGIESFSRAGAWNDPDMLHVGNGEFDGSPQGLAACRTHLALWAVMAAPMFVGTDLETIDEGVLGLLLNRDMLAVQSDPLARAGRRVVAEGAGSLWLRELHDGWALAFAAQYSDADVRIEGDTFWQDDIPFRIPEASGWHDVWQGGDFEGRRLAQRDCLLLTTR